MINEDMDEEFRARMVAAAPFAMQQESPERTEFTFAEIADWLSELTPDQYEALRKVALTLDLSKEQ